MAVTVFYSTAKEQTVPPHHATTPFTAVYNKLIPEGLQSLSSLACHAPERTCRKRVRTDTPPYLLVFALVLLLEHEEGYPRRGDEAEGDHDEQAHREGVRSVAQAVLVLCACNMPQHGSTKRWGRGPSR